MTIAEKVAYLKGLTAGMKIDESTNEGKVIANILDILTDISLTLEDYDETFEDMAEIVADLEESVYELEDEVFDDDFDFDGLDDLDEMYDVTCPKCDNTISLDYAAIGNGSLICPNCGEKIEFEIDFVDDEDCDCGVGHDH